MKGRKPTPSHLRVLTGTKGKIPLDRNQPKPQGDLFEPPGDLIAQAIPFWNEAIADAPRGLLKRLDKRCLAIWATAAWMHSDAAAKVARSATVVQSPTGQVYQHPSLSIMNRQALIMLRAAAEMGFTPSSRTRINVSREDDGEGNPFAEFG